MTDTTPTGRAGIAIVGGGLAGGTAAVELRERGYDGPLAIFAAEDHLPYERPPLSKAYLQGRDPIEKAYVRDAQWYADNDVDLHRGARVTALDLDAQALRTARATHRFDQILLATGARPRRLALADDSGRPVTYLRTIEDSDRLRTVLAGQGSLVIVGGGWIGLEVAAAAREAGCAVTVYETESLPLLAVLGKEVAQVFADLHRDHGVDLRLGAPVTAADLADAEHVLVGIGAVPDTTLAAAAGIAVDNGVLVDAELRASRPGVFAIGDIANQDHPALGRRLRVEHWDNAREQAKVAAHNLIGGHETYDRQPYFFTDQYDLGMEYVGNVGPGGYDRVEIDGDPKGAFRAYWVRDGVVAAAMHVNDWDASDEIRASIGTSR